MSDLNALSQYFSGFWKNEAIGAGSPLYAVLCDVVAASPSLLRLASESKVGQPAPNMLFAAVHAVLADHPGDPLAEYYLTFGGMRSPDEQLGACFEGFCQRWSQPLTEILHIRLVQTNEVRRCSFLLPALSFAWREGGRQPLALIEVGPSAGLNLLFDQYRYLYGGELAAGNPASSVEIDVDVRGPLSASDLEVPLVASRMGIDLNPLDVRDPKDAAWLAALTWPEHEDRRQLLKSATEVAKTANLDLVPGDAVTLLPPALAEVPPGVMPCIVATFVLHQLPPARRLDFRRMLEEQSRSRPFFFVAAGYTDFLGWDGGQEDGSTFVKVARLEGGAAAVRTLIHCHPHGRWLRYLDDTTWEPIPG